MYLGFSKSLEKLVEFGIHLIRAHFKQIPAEGFMKGLFNNAYAIFCSDFSKAYVIGTHLNEAIQMNTHKICFKLTIKK